MDNKNNGKDFGKGYWKTFEEGLQREWVITNGIGGYAGDTLIGAHSRKHHGMLIASLNPPTERYLTVSKLEERLIIGSEEYSLAANLRKGRRKEEGQRYLQRFSFDGVPAYTYHIQDVHVVKTIAMEYGHNTTAVGYEIRNGEQPLKLIIVPCFNFREHGEGSRISELSFSIQSHMKDSGMELCLTPDIRKDVKIRLYCSDGAVQENDREIYDADLELITEINTGMSGLDNNYKPYHILLSLEPFETKKISVVASVEEDYPKDAFTVIEEAGLRASALTEKAYLSWEGRLSGSQKSEIIGRNSLFSTLVQAADDFLVFRKSTQSKTILAGLPWFTDWGRDTMIAMEGLTLATGRYEDAKGILRTFAQYVKDGLVPNMFPDEGIDPLYNTADASLWYFYAVDRYLIYTDTDTEYDFIKNEIYPRLEEIMAAYRQGTSFSIYMAEDGLIHAGGGLDQVTWMDVRVDDWVVTPRHGKPVEINALWYNALKVMERLTRRFRGEEAAEVYGRLAGKVKKSFGERFWNPELECLYDVVDEEELKNQPVNNAQIRPNQIYAVSLPYTTLEREQEKAVVNSVFSHLYTTYGLRSLSPTDEQYHPVYSGTLPERDAAYHQGTAWGFLMGAFITAYVKVNDYSAESVLYAKSLLEGTADHLWDGCIGQIAEIFDGEDSGISRGCYAQAWSVGETLRAYMQDIVARLS